MENVRQNSTVLRKIISLLLAFSMSFSFGVNIVFAADDNFSWTITDYENGQKAILKGMDFTYYSTSTEIVSGTYSGKDYVASEKSNGSASGGIVSTKSGTSYCEYPATKDGTLTAYIGYSSSNAKILTISKTNVATDESKAVGQCIALASETDGNENEDELKITREKDWIIADIEVESGYTYYITVTGSKMRSYGAEFVPYTEISGKISDSFNISDFGVKFTNSTTGQVKNADVDTVNKTYSIKLKPGYTYSAGLTGSSAASYAFSQDTRVVSPTGETCGCDLVIEECVSYTITGSLSGFSADYNLDDFELRFVPKDINDFETAIVNVDKNNLTYSASLVSDEEYTLQKSGANDYDFTEEVTVKNTVAKSPSSGNPENTGYIYGDANNSKNLEVADAVAVLEKVLDASKVLDIEKENENYMEFVDIDSDGVLTAVDVSFILQKVLNNSFAFPDGKNNDTSDDSGDNSGSGDTSIEKNVSFKLVDTYQADGKFIGLTSERGVYENLDVNPTSITFKNVEDSYTYNGTVSDGGYSANLRNGAYIASIVSDAYSTTTHIVIDNGAVSKNILLKFEGKTDVSYSDTLYVGEDKEYTTVQAAVDAVSNMTRPNNERVTIKIDPGTYREQVHVTAPNITLESNGGDRTNTKITWYYGIGYKYYSTVNNIYDPYAEYDKYEKGNVVSYWGATVLSERTAEGFSAKGICFENSFNKYMTDEEIADGVEPNGLQSIKVQRKENTEVDTKEATERAAALVNYADKTEFLGCGFIGSQDTLYTCNVNYKAYYKNCYIEGQTDYIYGNGDVIFDGCELNWCGYNGTEAAGYITAHSGSEKYLAEYGYVFRNCLITGNKDKNRNVVAGALGRMWGTHATVNFINTQLEDDDYLDAEGWNSGMNSPNLDTVNVKEYNTTYNGEEVDTSKRVTGVVSDPASVADYTVEKVFIENGWTPAYYTSESDDPEIVEGPSFTSNGDLNAPNPGETVTVNYKLNDGCADVDASRISWYAVDTEYTDESLENILESSTLLYTTAAYKTNKFQLPMESAGKYFMAVITPITIGGKAGEPKYIIDTEKVVSNTWSNPNNVGELAPGSGINIYLAGDSTVKDYSAKGMYNKGTAQALGAWGEFLQNFFDENCVTVNNYAQGGRSGRIFVNEGTLDKIKNNIKAGDYLFIQFGHNDCANKAAYYADRFAPLYASPKGADVTDAVVDSDGIVSGGIYPTVLPTEDLKDSSGFYTWNCGATYKGYLQAHINVALDAGAVPVIVSPVARMYYNSDGTIRTHHDATGTDYEPTKDYRTSGNAYVAACKQLYEENIEAGNEIYYLDGYDLTETLFEDLWKISSDDTNGQAIMGSGDSTHCNKTGGIIEAGLFAKWIQDADLSISKYVIQPTTAYGENPDGNYIFTIKDKVFEACDNSYNVNENITSYGQKLFDSIGGNSLAATYTISGSTNLTGGTLNVFDSNDKKVASAEIGTDGTYTFTISTAAGILENSYSAEVDGYGKEEIKMTASESEPTVYTAEEINFKEEIVINAVSLDFSDTNTLALYETNADSTFKDGVYTGVYTNDENQAFDASVYKVGIKYFESKAYYGTSMGTNTPLFSFDADGEGMYTLTVSAAATGSGTVDLFKSCSNVTGSGSCSDSAASIDVPSGETVNLIYKKASNEKETLYFGASNVSNLYIKSVAVKKEELPEDVSVNVKGTVNGIENDDTNVIITLKGETETKTISVSDYTSNGIELISGEKYSVTAVGDKGYYKGTTFAAGESGEVDFVFSRVYFEFPLDLSENFDDYKDYLTAMGYGSKDVTDAYSGITVHNNGMIMYTSCYGAKTNAEDIVSFTAEKSGTLTVSVNVTTASTGDAFQLKINGTYVDDSSVDASIGTVTMSTTVSKGDTITISAPKRGNLYYNKIEVKYE